MDFWVEFDVDSICIALEFNECRRCQDYLISAEKGRLQLVGGSDNQLC